MFEKDLMNEITDALKVHLTTLSALPEMESAAIAAIKAGIQEYNKPWPENKPILLVETKITLIQAITKRLEQLLQAIEGDVKYARLLEELDQIDWDITYSMQFNESAKSYLENEGVTFYQAVRSVGTLCQTLTQLKQFTSTIEPFMKGFENVDDSDLNIISIGCSGKKEQQLYPELLDFSEKHPDLKIQINLFDEFGGYDKVGANTNQELPKLLVEDSLNYVPQWCMLEKKQYQHKTLQNIKLNVYQGYFPLFEGSELIAEKFYPVFLHAIKKQLHAGKRVVISQHTGGQAFDDLLIKLNNTIFRESKELYENLFIFRRFRAVFRPSHLATFETLTCRSAY